MSDQRIDTGAEAASGPDADPGEGQGAAAPGGHADPAATGEVSAEPSPERRAADPGSVATEFGDRADSASEDDIARPTI
jgi:hypothetical protein